MKTTTATDSSADTKKTGVLGTLSAAREKQRVAAARYAKTKDAVNETRQMLRYHARSDLMIKRTAAQWSPWAVSGALFTIAVANTVAANITGDALATGTYTLAGAAMVLAAGVLAIRRRCRLVSLIIPETPAQRRWVLVCAGAAMAWLATAVVVGITINTTGPLMGLALMVGTAALARTHWQRHRIGDLNHPQLPVADPVLPLGAAPDGADATENTGDEGDDSDSGDGIPEEARAYLDKWEEWVRGGRLKDSILEFDSAIWGDNPRDDTDEDVRVGWRYRLWLPKQGVVFETVLAELTQISYSLEVPREELSVERIAPTEDNPRPNPRLVHFEVIDNSPILKSVPMLDSRYRCTRDEDGNVTEGWIDCGPYRNGDGGARWRVYSGGDSMWGGFILGGTGSGKTVLLDSIAFSLAASGHTAVWYIDGQATSGQAASSPFIPEIADWSAATDEAQEDMLAALEDIADLRAAENARYKMRGFTPTEDRPGLAVIVDECHLVLNPDNAKRWEELARIARKVGICLIMATQAAQFDSFGRSETLRSQLLAGNTLVLRVTGITQSGFIPGLEMDPTTLPPIAGYGYTVASNNYGRTAPFRGVFCPDYTALWNHLGYTVATLDRRARGAANVATDNRYRDRHEIAEQAFAGIDDRFAALDAAADGAAPADGDTTGTAAAPAPRRQPEPQPSGELERMIETANEPYSGHDEAEQLMAYLEQELAANDERVAAEAAETGPQSPVTVESLMEGLNDLQYDVLNVVCTDCRDHGVSVTGDIISAVGKPRQRVNDALNHLKNLGLVSNRGHGKHGVTASMEAHLAQFADA